MEHLLVRLVSRHKGELMATIKLTTDCSHCTDGIIYGLGGNNYACDKCTDGTYLIGEIDLSDLEDKIDDVMDKCNDIMDKLNE